MASKWEEVPIPKIMQKHSPQTRCFQKYLAFGGRLQVLAGREPNGLFHMSIAHVVPADDMRTRPGRMPTYEEIKEARYRFCPKDCVMAMMFPPMDQFVNFHETTMQLWEVRRGSTTEDAFT